MRGIKKQNEYSSALENYAHIPKSVFAAVAFSFALRIIGNDSDTAEAETLILNEWNALYTNGIVPQPPRSAR